MKRIFGTMIAFILLMLGCKDEITLLPEKQIFTTELTGKVVLENQTEHSNALVYLDSLDRGVSTDSNGFYSFIFRKDDTVYNGVFKVYYFVNDYEMDSAQYVLVNGKVKLDSLDVDSEGNLPIKELEQLVLVEGWTDKQEYRIGDKIEFIARFTNLSNRTIHIFIPSFWDPFGFVGLYNDKYPIFILSPCDPVATDGDIFLFSPNGYYQGRRIYTIRDRNYCVDSAPLVTDEYIVVANLFIENRLITIKNKLYKFIHFEWYKLAKGNSPKLDYIPNKYKFPIIKVIE